MIMMISCLNLFQLYLNQMEIKDNEMLLCNELLYSQEMNPTSRVYPGPCDLSSEVLIGQPC